LSPEIEVHSHDLFPALPGPDGAADHQLHPVVETRDILVGDQVAFLADAFAVTGRNVTPEMADAPVLLVDRRQPSDECIGEAIVIKNTASSVTCHIVFFDTALGRICRNNQFN
jgi:hypothetical protein